MTETKEQQLAKFKAEIRRAQQQNREVMEPTWMRRTRLDDHKDVERL